MKCFYSPAEDAVGICKSCGKGLSAGYAADLGRGLACKDRCETDVRKLISMIERNERMSEASEELVTKSPKAAHGHALFLMLAGLLFGIAGYLREREPLLLGLGVLFLLYGTTVSIRAGRIAKAVRAGERPR